METNFVITNSCTILLTSVKTVTYTVSVKNTLVFDHKLGKYGSTLKSFHHQIFKETFYISTIQTSSSP